MTSQRQETHWTHCFRISQILSLNLSLEKIQANWKASTLRQLCSHGLLSQFNVLLNNLSNELSSENLQSLIYVCGELISEHESEKISSGWDAFKILIRRNAIGEKPMKMAFLLEIIKELRPQRKDLVNMVKRYIEDHHREPQKIMDA